jgi:4-hydroxy-2-oxoglutarate aldolase
MNAFDAGNVALAEELNVKSLALNKISSTAYGMPGLKVACDMLGFEGGHVRNPLLDLSPEEAAKFKVEFADFFAKNFGKTL